MLLCLILVKLNKAFCTFISYDKELIALMHGFYDEQDASLRFNYAMPLKDVRCTSL